MSNSIETFKVAILHPNTDLNHLTGKNMSDKFEQIQICLSCKTSAFVVCEVLIDD